MPSLSQMRAAVSRRAPATSWMCVQPCGVTAWLRLWRGTLVSFAQSRRARAGGVCVPRFRVWRQQEAAHQCCPSALQLVQPGAALAALTRHYSRLAHEKGRMAAASGVAHDQRQRRTEKGPASAHEDCPMPRRNRERAVTQGGADAGSGSGWRVSRARCASGGASIEGSGKPRCPDVASLRAAGGAGSRRVRAAFAPEGTNSESFRSGRSCLQSAGGADDCWALNSSASLRLHHLHGCLPSRCCAVRQRSATAQASGTRLLRSQSVNQLFGSLSGAGSSQPTFQVTSSDTPSS